MDGILHLRSGDGRSGGDRCQREPHPVHYSLLVRLERDAPGNETFRPGRQLNFPTSANLHNEDRVEHGCQAVSITGAASLLSLGNPSFLANR